MKLEEFKKLFPHADFSYFKEVDGYVIFDSKRKFLERYDVSEPAFWDNEKSVSHLNLSTTDFMTYIMASDNFLSIYKRMRNYHSPKKSLEKAFQWKPEEWAPKKTFHPPSLTLSKNTLNLDFESFRIYVNDSEYFVLKDSFPDFSDISKIDWKDSKNSYTLSLKIFYILSYLSGISLMNLKSENNLANSLAHFFFYYHFKKFWNYRDFSSYDFSDLESFPVFNSLYHWTHHHVRYHPRISYTKENLKRNKHDVIDHITHKGNWVYYQSRSSKRDISKDFLKLILEKSDGISKVGQLLLQESNQAYVFSILGSQAKTHWKIIGDGANSLQTQNVFKTLVGEVIASNNLSNLIKSMRIAITATKVRLDFCISPGLELLPSDYVFIKDSPGYNNILLISSEKQKFGSNNVNSTKKRVKEIEDFSEKSQKESSDISKDFSEIPQKSPEKTSDKKLPVSVYQQTGKTLSDVNNTSIIMGSALIAIVGRILWVAFL